MKMKVEISTVLSFLVGFFLGLQVLLLHQGGIPPKSTPDQFLAHSVLREHCDVSLFNATLQPQPYRHADEEPAQYPPVTDRSSSEGANPYMPRKQILPYLQQPLCFNLGSQLSPVASAIPSTATVWNLWLKDILLASQPASDRKYALHDFTAQLLALASPRLHKSLGRIPADFATVRRILTKLHKRLVFTTKVGGGANHGTNETLGPPPIKIVTLGGSVLMGRNCATLARDLNYPVRRNMRQCSWSMRLEHFLNKLAGRKVVEVHMIAYGGTNSAVGTTFFEYDLLPEAARDPDIVINAYSTNDMHIFSVMSAQEKNQTMRELLHEMIESFVRSVNGDCASSHRPLLLHMDDYQGNEQLEVLAISELSQVVHVLSSHYGFGTMSYADVVRDLVLRDTRETWFSPPGWYDKDQISGGMSREIHPPMGMHIVTMWVAAYYFLHLTTTYCGLEVLGVAADSEEYYNASYLARLAPLKASWHKSPDGRPRHVARGNGLPPELAPHLALSEISGLWNDNSTVCPDQSPPSGAIRCLFAWQSTVMGDHDWIQRQFASVTTIMTGWKLSSDHDKLGYVPSHSNDTMLLEFRNVSQPLRKVAVWYMRSYGPLWKNSRLVVDVEQLRSKSSWQTVASNTLKGVHGKNTSEMYTEVMKVHVPVHSTLRLRLTFTGANGTTFKLMGLAVCR